MSNREAADGEPNASAPEWRSIFILIPMRLGVDKINPMYLIPIHIRERTLINLDITKLYLLVYVHLKVLELLVENQSSPFGL